jgi:hypothetical protein
VPSPQRYFPDEQLLGLMIEARRRGEAFEAAWEEALPQLRMGTDTSTRQAWTAAFAWTRDSWRRAYEGEPPTPAETAAVYLVGLGNGRAIERPAMPAVAA